MGTCTGPLHSQSITYRTMVYGVELRPMASGGWPRPKAQHGVWARSMALDCDPSAPLEASEEEDASEEEYAEGENAS